MRESESRCRGIRPAHEIPQPRESATQNIDEIMIHPWQSPQQA